MKIISVRQPWASAIVQGIKPVENRSWVTNYRGQVLIHAGVSRRDLKHLNCTPLDQYADSLDLTFGAIIGLARIIDCVPLSDLPASLRGNPFASGPYCWILEDARAIESPIPCRGQLGLFNAPADIVRSLGLEQSSTGIERRDQALLPMFSD